MEKYKLCGIDFAVRNIHSPSNKEALKIALYRLVFEEFLILQLGLFYFKSGVNESSGIEFKENEKLNDIIESLPFKLTKAQNRALSEITQDMTSSKVMNRLVQGDVGSCITCPGKCSFKWLSGGFNGTYRDFSISTL